jgi:hypothetical protein
MAATSTRRPLDELCRLGDEIFRTRIQPKLGPEFDGKFVVIDVDTGEYEIDDKEYPAFAKLDARFPDSDKFLARAGYRGACSFGGAR